LPARRSIEPVTVASSSSASFSFGVGQPRSAQTDRGLTVINATIGL
jgi:hypothetical protein